MIWVAPPWGSEGVPPAPFPFLKKRSTGCTETVLWQQVTQKSSESHQKMIRNHQTWHFVRFGLCGSSASPFFLSVEKPRLQFDILLLAAWNKRNQQPRNPFQYGVRWCSQRLQLQAHEMNTFSFLAAIPRCGDDTCERRKGRKEGKWQLEWLDIKISAFCNCLFIYNR